MAIQIIVGAAKINAAIKSIATRGAKLDESIQIAGLSVLAHVTEHGDTSVADNLFNAMPKGARRLALVEWMLAFGQLRTLSAQTKEEKQRIALGQVFAIDRSKTLNLEGAAEKPWHEMRKEAAPAVVFDAQAQVKALLTRLQKAITEGKEIKGMEEAKAELHKFFGV